jgi:enoyl-CoA hydratase/carnithine racemase
VSASVSLVVESGVARVRISNPGKRNAFTWAMYEQLESIARQIGNRDDVRAVVLEGNADDGFAAGTDIGQFDEFVTGEDGLRYERRTGEVFSALLAIPVPTIALVQRTAVGAGLAVAACCDIVLAECGALFGAPIARTIGNCLPAPVVARLRGRLGPGLTSAMLLTATLVPAERLLDGGFIFQVVDPGELWEAASPLLSRITSAAPITLRCLKELNRRLDAQPLPDDEDLIRLCYGSADFHEGVKAFLAGRAPDWTGR